MNVLGILSCFLLGVQAQSPEPRPSTRYRVIYSSSQAPAPIGPYNQAVEIDGILYLSGQIGLDAVTGEMAQGVEEQAMLALTNMQHIMEVAGIGFSNVIKATVFLADINDFDTVNQVYEKFFVEHFPARAAVQVANLPKGALVEIEAVAVVGDDIDTQYVSG